MPTVREQLNSIFSELDEKIKLINQERLSDGSNFLAKAEVKILGQMSLLVHKKVSLLLSLTQTADLDALLVMDHLVKVELKKILKKQGLIYDEDSCFVWIPKDAKFEGVFEFDHIAVKSIDPESALVSKAVKAPEKNKQLIREAIASNQFSTLVDRIIKNGGKLENFV